MNERDVGIKGLQNLSEREYEISGGLSLKKIIEIMDKIFYYAEKAEKYWPSFKDGFKKGWEAA